MHKQTFDIQEFETPKAAKVAGYTIPLSKPEAALLKPMSVNDRKQWSEQQQANRNAAKRARKARRAGRK